MKKLLMPRNLLFVCILFLIAGILSGCSGTLYTAKMDGNEKKFEGVRFYPLKLFLEVYETTAFINKKGEIIADSEDQVERNCIPQKEIKVVIRPDFSQPYRIYYNSGFLESNKFGVTLKDGALVSVNTESQPDRGTTLKNLGEAATKFAPPGVLGMDGAPPLACNATPVLTGIFEAPKAKPFPERPTK